MGQNDTPAQRRMREHFLPAFMRLKQPAMPGRWGAWDPAKGSLGEAISEWPTFDVADVPGDASMVASDRAQRDTTTQMEGGNDKRIFVERTPAMGQETEVTSADNVRRSHDSIYITQVTSIPDSALETSSFPSQTFFPVPTSTNTDPSQSSGSDPNRSDLVYKSPVISPRLISATIDWKQDAKIKQAMRDAENNRGESVMFGVAAPPPISFPEEDDFEKDLAAANTGPENAIALMKDIGNSETVVVPDMGTSSRDTDLEQRPLARAGNIAEKEESGRGSAWFGQGSGWWKVDW